MVFMWINMHGLQGGRSRALYRSYIRLCTFEYLQRFLPLRQTGKYIAIRYRLHTLRFKGKRMKATSWLRALYHRERSPRRMLSPVSIHVIVVT